MATAAGERIYAIGDVHGRWDLLELMLAAIARHEELPGPELQTRILFTGDIIDRGSDSRRCIEAVRRLCDTGYGTCLLGNHEALMLSVIDGDANALRPWLRHGGRDTLASYGMDATIDIADAHDLGDRLSAVVPPEHINFLRSLPLSFSSGDYMFVHAGVRPAVPIDRQQPSDLIWIRNAFLEDKRWHGAMIVHGHTTVPTVEFRANRIAIDTEAWRSGMLSCVMLEDDVRTVLTVQL